MALRNEGTNSLMADFDFIIKRNDWGVREPLKAILEILKVDEETGEPELDFEGNEIWEAVDLTGCEVHLSALSDEALSESSKVRIKTSAATSWGGGALGADGKVEYQFEPEEGEDPPDLAFAGAYNMEFVVFKAGSFQMRIPNEGMYRLKIEQDTGP